MRRPATVGRVREVAVHDEHTEDGERSDRHHRGVDDAGPVPARRYSAQQANETGDHQRVHAEVQRVGRRRERGLLLHCLEDVVADVG